MVRDRDAYRVRNAKVYDKVMVRNVRKPITVSAVPSLIKIR